VDTHRSVLYALTNSTFPVNIHSLFKVPYRSETDELMADMQESSSSVSLHPLSLPDVLSSISSLSSTAAVALEEEQPQSYLPFLPRFSKTSPSPHYHQIDSLSDTLKISLQYIDYMTHRGCLPCLENWMTLIQIAGDYGDGPLAVEVIERVKAASNIGIFPLLTHLYYCDAFFKSAISASLLPK
jgi:hypothetical protein